jgi:hypothetical protein
VIIHRSGYLEITNSSFLNISLTIKPVIELGWAVGTPDYLQLNINNSSFTGVESRGNFPAVIGTIGSQV